MKKIDSTMLKKIIQLFKPLRKKIILLLVCITLSSFLSLITPMLNRKLIDSGLLAKNSDVVIRYAAYNIVIIILMQGISILETKYRSYLENIVIFQLEKDAINHLLHMKLSFFNDVNYVQTVENIKTDIQRISSLCNTNTFYMVTGVLRIIVGTVGLLAINWKLSIMIFIIIPIYYLLVILLSRKRINYCKIYMQLDERYSAWKGDTFAGIREVKNWCMERIKMRQFIKQQRAIIGQDIKLAYLENANQIVETVFQEGLKMLMYIGGVFFIINGSLTIGELFAFVIYSDYVISPLFSILDIPYIFAGITPSAKRYFEFLERESEITAGKKVHIKGKKVNGEIRFCNVDFGYSKEKTLLKNINFTIKPGEKIGIIGENGSGKSTIVNLIMRFLEPDSGYILLDGININQIDLSEYRSFMAIVSQEIYLFHCSIRENIMLSSRESEERFKSVVEKCGINKFVCKLSKQYESSVGERGSRFSGGERQKIAMARAMMRDAKILILDEATANYDVKSEQEINEVISKDYNDKTIIIITHKPEILKKMNKIVVMDHGKIADIGKYKELYGRNMFCRKMVENYIHK